MQVIWTAAQFLAARILPAHRHGYLQVSGWLLTADDYVRYERLEIGDLQGSGRDISIKIFGLIVN